MSQSLKTERPGLGAEAKKDHHGGYGRLMIPHRSGLFFFQAIATPIMLAKMLSINKNGVSRLS